MSPFYEAWFFWAGVVFTGILFLGIAYLLTVTLLWPIVESISLTRCTVKGLGKHRVNSVFRIWLWAIGDCIGGRNWDTVRNNFYSWSGVGDWVVYTEENQDESA